MPPQHCVYVGDAERDIIAGRAAGMQTVVAAYGYLVPMTTPTAWNADGIIQRPDDSHRLADAATLNGGHRG